MQPAVQGAPGHEILESLAVPNPTGNQGKRFPCVAIRRSKAAGQQLDRLGQRGLAGIVGSDEDRQRSKLQFDPASVSLVPFESYSSEFHGRHMITVRIVPLAVESAVTPIRVCPRGPYPNRMVMLGRSTGASSNQRAVMVFVSV